MAITNTEDIEKTISAYIVANWTSTTIVPPNKEQDVKALTSFITWHNVYFGPRRLTITGSSSIGLDYKGQIVIGIYVKPNIGTGGIKIIIDNLFDIFCEKAIVVTSSRYLQTGVPEIEPIGKDGVWWHETLKIPWEYIR